MKKSLVFSEDDLLWVFELDGTDKKIFPNVDSLRDALISDRTEELIKDSYGYGSDVRCKVAIQANEVEYPISVEMKDYINSQYNDKLFLEPVGNVLHQKPDAIKWRRERYRQIYGDFPDD